MTIISDEVISLIKVESSSDIHYLEQCLNDQEFQEFLFDANEISIEKERLNFKIIKYNKTPIGVAYFNIKKYLDINESYLSIFINKKYRVYAFNSILKCFSYLFLDLEVDVVRFLVKSYNKNMNRLLYRLGIQIDGILNENNDCKKMYLYSITKEESLNFSETFNNRYL